MGSIIGDGFKTKRQIEAMHRDIEADPASETAIDDDEIIGEVEPVGDYDDYSADVSE